MKEADRSSPGAEPRTRPRAGLLMLIAAVGFQALSGIGGGLALVLDPSGGLLGMPLDLLEESPFGNYRVPGLVLLLVLGCFPLAVTVALWKRRSRAWHGAVLTGLALLVWIAAEIAMIGYQAEPPLQLVYGLVAFLILALTSLPSVRRQLRVPA